MFMQKFFLFLLSFLVSFTLFSVNPLESFAVGTNKNLAISGLRAPRIEHQPQENPPWTVTKNTRTFMGRLKQARQSKGVARSYQMIISQSSEEPTSANPNIEGQPLWKDYIKFSSQIPSHPIVDSNQTTSENENPIDGPRLWKDYLILSSTSGDPKVPGAVGNPSSSSEIVPVGREIPTSSETQAVNSNRDDALGEISSAGFVQSFDAEARKAQASASQDLLTWQTFSDAAEVTEAVEKSVPFKTSKSRVALYNALLANLSGKPSLLDISRLNGYGTGDTFAELLENMMKATKPTTVLEFVSAKFSRFNLKYAVEKLNSQWTKINAMVTSGQYDKIPSVVDFFTGPPDLLLSPYPETQNRENRVVDFLQEVENVKAEGYGVTPYLEKKRIQARKAVIFRANEVEAFNNFEYDVLCALRLKYDNTYRGPVMTPSPIAIISVYKRFSEDKLILAPYRDIIMQQDITAQKLLGDKVMGELIIKQLLILEIRAEQRLAYAQMVERRINKMCLSSRKVSQKAVVQLTRSGVTDSPARIRALDVQVNNLVYMLQLSSPGHNGEGVGLFQQIINNYCEEFLKEALTNDKDYKNLFDQFGE